MIHYTSLLSSKTKLVAVQHASNVLGTCNPVKDIVDMAKQHGAIVHLPACEAHSGRHLVVQ